MFRNSAFQILLKIKSLFLIQSINILTFCVKIVLESYFLYNQCVPFFKVDPNCISRILGKKGGFINFVEERNLSSFLNSKKILQLYISLSKHQSVSEWVCVCVWMFPNSSETANPSDLKFWGMIPLGMEKVFG